MKVIITGSTGMVGKGVLIQCLEDNRIKKILLVNRTSIKLNNKFKSFKDFLLSI